MEDDQVMVDVAANESDIVRDWLVDLHRKTGESLYKLGKRIDIAYSTLNHIFKHEISLSLTNYIKLCRGANISPAEYFLEEGTTVVSSDEMRLLEYYRRTTSPELRNIIMQQAESVSELKTQDEKE